LVDVDSNADPVADCKQHSETLTEFGYARFVYV
jgi:hypothetical protein